MKTFTTGIRLKPSQVKYLLFATVMLLIPITATNARTEEVTSQQPENSVSEENNEGLSHPFSEILPTLRCRPGTTLDEERSTEFFRFCRVETEDPNDEIEDVVYPLPDPSIEPHIVHERDLTQEINTAYPDWYRGTAEGFNADETSYHYYYVLIGAGLEEPGYSGDNLYCSSFFLRPEKTYFAHNHPTREFYYFFGGEGTWHSGDNDYEIGAGSFVVNPPYIAHGVTNTSSTEELKAFACWWRNPEDPKDAFNHRGLPLNPCRVTEEETAGGSVEPEVCAVQ